MSGSALSAVRLGRLRTVLAGHVARGDVPGLVALVARRGEAHVEALGTMAAGGGGPMRRDAIFRIASVSKQITAAAAMTLVEECRLRLDDPVDQLLPELADRRVLTEEQKAENTVFFGGASGWGFGVQVVTRRNDLDAVPGRFGWNGGTGVTAYTDPGEGLIGILLTQRYMDSPIPPSVFRDFWTCAYQAIDD